MKVLLQFIVAVAGLIFLGIAVYVIGSLLFFAASNAFVGGHPLIAGICVIFLLGFIAQIILKCAEGWSKK
jgi:hypothetical protein